MRWLLELGVLAVVLAILFASLPAWPQGGVWVQNPPVHPANVQIRDASGAAVSSWLVLAHPAATYPVSQSGTWTVQPGNTANTTAWKVDGSAVTQPISGTVQPGNTQNTTPWLAMVHPANTTAMLTRLSDATTLGTQATVRAGSTLSAASDTAVVVEQRPGKTNPVIVHPENTVALLTRISDATTLATQATVKAASVSALITDTALVTDRRPGASVIIHPANTAATLTRLSDATTLATQATVRAGSVVATVTDTAVVVDQRPGKTIPVMVHPENTTSMLMRLSDAATLATQATIKAASVAAASTDTAVVVDQRPGTTAAVMVHPANTVALWTRVLDGTTVHGNTITSVKPASIHADTSSSALVVSLRPTPELVCDKYVAISQTASTQLVAGNGNQKIYVCAFVAVAGAAEIISLTEGTGTACATNPVALMGSTTLANGVSLAANGAINLVSSRPFIRTAVHYQNLCLRQNTTNRVSGFISYTVQ